MKEPKLRYYLEPNRKELSLRKAKEIIMVEISYGYAEIGKNGKPRNKPFRISLKKSIEPSKFGKSEYNYKFDANVFQKSQINNATIKRAMQKLEDKVYTLYNNYDIEGIVPTPSEFKNDLELHLGRKEKLNRTQISILDYCYASIKKDEESLNRGVEGARKRNTIKTYNSICRHLENYHIATGDTLKFETFNLQTYWKFFETLDDILRGVIKVENPNQTRKKPTQYYGFLKTSLRKIQVSFLNVFKDALENDFQSDFNPNQKGLLVAKEESSKDFYVYESELEKIISTDVSHDYALQMAKEYFVIASLTGSRNESMNELLNENIVAYKDQTWDFRYVYSKHNKTSTEVFIPLLKPVQDIVDKYGGNFPKFYSNAKVNSYIKKLFEFLQIERTVTETLRTYRNGVIANQIPIYKLVSTHDAKKTFTTNLANHQMPESVISNIIHPDKPTKNKMFKVYNKMDMLDKAKMFIAEINKIDSNIYKF